MHHSTTKKAHLKIKKQKGIQVCVWNRGGLARRVELVGKLLDTDKHPVELITEEERKGREVKAVFSRECTRLIPH